MKSGTRPRKNIPLTNYAIIRAYNFWSRNHFGDNPMVRIRGHEIICRVLRNFAEFLVLRTRSDMENEVSCLTEEFIANKHPGNSVLTCSCEGIMVRIRCSQTVALAVQPLLELAIGKESYVALNHNKYIKDLLGWQLLAKDIKDIINEYKQTDKGSFRDLVQKRW